MAGTIALGVIVVACAQKRTQPIAQSATPQKTVAPAVTGPYQSLGTAGGAIISGVSPSSIEVGGATTTLAATGAGTATFESVLLLGP